MADAACAWFPSSEHDEHSAQEDNTERHHFESHESLTQEDHGEERRNEGTEGSEDRYDTDVSLFCLGEVGHVPEREREPGPRCVETLVARRRRGIWYTVQHTSLHRSHRWGSVMRYTKMLVAAAASVALASGAAIAATGPAHAAKATGSITMTLKPGLAYVITGDHWVGVKPARTGIEPAGTPFPGPTVTFPVSFEDGAFKVRGKGELALGPGSISARKPLVSATPDQLARGKAQVSFVVGNGNLLIVPFYVKNFEKVGTDTEGFVRWTGDLHATKDKKTLRDFNGFSGLTGNKALKPGQALGVINIDVKAS